MLRRLANEKREVEKCKLTAIANFEKLSPSSQRSERANTGSISFSKFAMAVNLPLSTSR